MLVNIRECAVGILKTFLIIYSPLEQNLFLARDCPRWGWKESSFLDDFQLVFALNKTQTKHTSATKNVYHGSKSEKRHFVQRGYRFSQVYFLPARGVLKQKTLNHKKYHRIKKNKFWLLKSLAQWDTLFGRIVMHSAAQDSVWCELKINIIFQVIKCYL